MKQLFNRLAASCLLLSAAFLLQANIKLPEIIDNGMVLQRNHELKLWGWADPGEIIILNFRTKEFKTQCDSEGNWELILPPQGPGGPFTMEFRGHNNIQLNDVYVGDVWLAAGQSNMVHYMDIHRDLYEQDIMEAAYPAIRQFLVTQADPLDGPSMDLAGGEWKGANPEDIKRFSVVAYFFALELYKKYGVPIGIINASVGGTPIESWTSEEGFSEFPGILERIQRNKDTAYVNGVNRAARESRKQSGPYVEKDRGLTGPLTWFDPSYRPINWRRISVPGYWEDQGVKDLDGVVWYRREIELTPGMQGKDAMLALGRIIDAERVYFNGEKVGETHYKYPQRWYKVPADLMREGKNILVVRVRNDYGKGGFVPDKPYYLAAGGDTLELTGYWNYKVGEVYRHEERFLPGISAQNQPTALFNGMVAPYVKYALKGVLWYQGESNGGRPLEYKKLLPALVYDWRKQWKEDKLPFLIVQLPNYMDVSYLPEESNWALMREAQLETLSVPHTGLAVTIDLGEWNDVHPGRKKPVGQRLAYVAMKKAYGEKHITWSGPMLESHKIDGDHIILSFTHTGSGLQSSNGEELAHFAIAGDDKKFRWAKAEIKGDKVVVWSPEVPEPKYVRYAWADNPVFANLANKEGLPASPFRTDGQENDQ